MGWQDAPVVDAAPANAPGGEPAWKKDAPVVDAAPANAPGGEPAWKKDPPAKAPDAVTRALDWAGDQYKKRLLGPAETIANVATAAPASLGGGLTYLATLAASRDPEAAKAVQEDTQRSLTYQPRTDAGQAGVRQVGQALDTVIEKPTEWAGEKAADLATYLGRSPETAGAVGAAVKTGLQAIPYALGAKPVLKAGVEAAKETAGRMLGREEKPAAPAGPAPGEAKAREYVARNTVLDFNALPAALRAQMVAMADQGLDLTKLDPTQLERIARAGAQRVPVPTLRSNVTRDLADITREEGVVRAPTSGARVREKMAAQDKALHQNFDALADAYAPGSKIGTSVDAGPPIQLAGRRKLQWLQGDYRRAYQKAENAGELQAPADTGALQEWVAGDPGRGANVGWVLERLKQYAEKNTAEDAAHQAAVQAAKEAGQSPPPAPAPKVTLKNLEALHGELSAEAEAGGRKGYAASEAAKVVDRMLNEQGGSLFKEARRKFARTQEETKNQTIVRDLVGEKVGTSDRRVALERTTDYVIRSSAESIGKLKKTLLEGGSKQTRAAGERAWNDLRRGILLKLREEAAGRRSIKNEKGQLQFDSKVLDLFNDLDRSGKLEMLYGKVGATELRSLAETIRDVRTKPSDRVAGPNTMPRLLAAFEFIASHKIPGLKDLSEAYVERQEAKRAVTNPVEEAAAEAAKAGKKSAVKRTYRDRARASAAGSTQKQSEEQP
jgi:hypothetical protein